MSPNSGLSRFFATTRSGTEREESRAVGARQDSSILQVYVKASHYSGPAIAER